MRRGPYFITKSGKYKWRAGEIDHIGEGKSVMVHTRSCPDGLSNAVEASSAHVGIGVVLSPQDEGACRSKLFKAFSAEARFGRP